MVDEAKVTRSGSNQLPKAVYFTPIDDADAFLAWPLLILLRKIYAIFSDSKSSISWVFSTPLKNNVAGVLSVR